MKTKGLNQKKIKDNIDGYLFILPLIIYFIVFQLLPILMAFGISFTDWNILSDEMKFIGFKNYYELFTDRLIYPYFYKSLLVTFEYMLLTIPASVIITLIVSAMLCSKIKGERFFKTAFYVPSVTVGVAVAAMWKFMVDPSFGLINQILGTHISFLGDKGTALLTLSVMSVWGGLGYNTLIMVSAMKNIDTSLYEAAEIDGANAFKRFIHVTIPGVMPTLFFICITSMIGSFQAFDQMYLMTGGGPEHTTFTYMYGVYNQAFEYYNIGTASAMSYILFVIILIFTFIQFKVVPQRVDEGQGKQKKGGSK